MIFYLFESDIYIYMLKLINAIKLTILYVSTMLVSPMFHYITRNEFKYSRFLWYSLYAPLFYEISLDFKTNTYILWIKKKLFQIKNDVICGNKYDSELDIMSKAFFCTFYVQVFIGFDKIWKYFKLGGYRKDKYNLMLNDIEPYSFESTFHYGAFPAPQHQPQTIGFFKKLNYNTKGLYSSSETSMTWRNLFNKELEYTIPSSSEMRGIVELYSLDMLILIFIGITIFLLLSKSLLWESLDSLYTYVKKNVLKERTAGLQSIKNTKSLIAIFAWLVFSIKETVVWIESNLKLKIVQPLFFENILRIFSIYLRTIKVFLEYNFYITMRNNLSITRMVKYTSAIKSILHWTNLEFIWTLIPCAILLILSVPSFTLALALDETYRPFLWVSVIGNQWFWNYEITTNTTKVELSSVILQGDDLRTNALRLLVPDNLVSIPVNKFTRFMISSVDVIHSWAVPGLGIKVDACPGRINSVTVLPSRLGVYYGQCSEICGVNHAFMPICVEVVA